MQFCVHCLPEEVADSASENIHPLRFLTLRHLFQRSLFSTMEALQQKAKLTDDRIQQLKSLIAHVGQIDPQAYIHVLKDENTRLKERVQTLVNQLTALEGQRGVTQQYDFANKVPKTPQESSKPPAAAAVPATAVATATGGKEAEGKGKKDKKSKGPKEEKPATATAAAANAAVDITRLDMRVGKIVSVEKHPDADSLYVEQIDVGEEKPRTVCSGLVKHMQPSDLDQKLVIVLCNLKPAKMRNILSEAMVMCASTADKVELLEPPSGSKPGDRVECDGYNCSSPDAQVKKELSDLILPQMSTNEKGEATYSGKLWRVANGKGVIKSKSLVNVPIK